MLSILLVTGSGREEPPTPAAPAVEILHASGLEEALEKLGRNRRIDAVLLLAGNENAQIAEAIREDNPAPPPLFALAPDAPAGAHPLPVGSPSESIDRLIAEIS